MRKHHEYHHHAVTLSLPQFHKLRKGFSIQLSHHQLDPSKQHKHRITVHHETHKKIARAIRHRKGVRLSLSPTEFEMSGEGIGDWFRKIRDGLSTAGSWVKKNIIDSDLYQRSVKPIVHDLVDQGINTAAALAGARGGPRGQQLAQDVGRAAANKFYEATGAGMHKKRVTHKMPQTPARRQGGALRGGYEPNRYGHGSTQGEVEMTASDVRKVLPASQFTPLISPSKYPSLIQHSQAVKGSGMHKKRKPRGRRGGVYGGSFRMA